jgi:hypothetical protein
MADLLTNVKKAVMISGNAYDTWLNSLIESAKLDLRIAGVEYAAVDDLVSTAFITYVRMHFDATGAELERLQRSYEMQKAQLMVARDYTNYGGGNA